MRASVYFISTGNAVKVGRAHDVAKRLEQLQTASPVLLVVLATISAPTAVDARDLERAIHRALRPHRIRGEWFATYAVFALLNKRTDVRWRHE